MINVRDFGAGNGATDDTAAIMAAVAASQSQLRAQQPPGGSWIGSMPELFFPGGRYFISSPIPLSGYQSVRGEDAFLIQNDPTKNIFEFTGCYHNRVSGMNFLGGRRQVQFLNQNVDFTNLIIRDCGFQGWGDIAVTAEGTVGDLHMSATLAIENSTFDGGTALLTRCDATILQSCRHQFRGGTIVDGTVAMINKAVSGCLYVDKHTATPCVPDRLGKVFWIDNYGSVFANGCRFGGEFAGIPIVRDNGDPNLVNPWWGRAVSICNSQVSCGQNAWPESALLTLLGVPQQIRIVGNRGIVSSTIPVIKAGTGYDLAAAVQSITNGAPVSLSLYSVKVESNQFYAPTPIPGPLLQFVK